MQRVEPKFAQEEGPRIGSGENKAVLRAAVAKESLIQQMRQWRWRSRDCSPCSDVPLLYIVHRSLGRCLLVPVVRELGLSMISGFGGYWMTAAETESAQT